MLPSTIVLTAAAGIAFAAVPAHADEPRVTALIVHESDLQTQKARRTLDRRIRTAAEEVCGVNAAAEGESWGEIKVCQARVRQDMYRQIAAANLSNGARLAAQ